VFDTDRRRVGHFKKRASESSEKQGRRKPPSEKKKSIINVLRERIARFLTYLRFGRLLMIHATPALSAQPNALRQKLTVPKAWVSHGKNTQKGVFFLGHWRKRVAKKEHSAR